MISSIGGILNIKKKKIMGVNNMEKEITKLYEEMHNLAEKLADKDAEKYKVNSSEARHLLKQKHLINMLVMYGASVDEECGVEL